MKKKLTIAIVLAALIALAAVLYNTLRKGGSIVRAEAPVEFVS